ncbi:hypothetical protein KPL71_023867 [Citrus sinensis]|uniref:Uncharacterized protein n=1 Tax=Citrus sinensis TaxID=2711 RepID=A0ACB8IMA4_CITSI|nr:hypothetical protein KPL71_023867 [Citrus sinensis]
MLAHRYNGPEFDQKEKEIRHLKAELAQIESEKQRPTLFTTSPLIPSIGPTYHPFASMLSPIKQYDPSKLFGMTHTLFRDNPLPPPPKPKPKSKPQPRPVTFHQSSISIPGHQSSGSTPASPSVPPPTLSQPPTQSKDKEPMHQFTAHTVAHSSTYSSTIDDQTSDSNLAVSDSHTETDTESSAQGQTSHTEPYVDIPSEVEEEMPESSATNQPSPAQAQTNPPSQKSSNGPWFTFDDLPSHKWRERLNEMSAWIDLQMLRPRATTQSVLREFATRFTGALRDWFDSLGQYRQLQFFDLPEVSCALAVLHDKFLGDPSAVFEAARRDYLNMKCCSLNAKDLDFHYKRMSLLFYKLNGFNEPTLKHVYLASLPEELQSDIQRQLTASNLALDNISLGKIFQLAKTCLDKLCEQKQFFKELLKDKEPFRSACKKPYHSGVPAKSLTCRSNAKRKRIVIAVLRRKGIFEYSKLQTFHKDVADLESPTDFSERNHPFPENSNESTQVDASSARKKVIMLKIVPTKEKNPSDEPNDETVFALQNSSDDSDSDQSQVIFHQQLLSLDTTVPIPSIKLHILPSKFQRPIPAIGLIDTGAQRSMINPNILPPEYWTKFEENFRAVNGKLFTTSLITTKPIGSHDEHCQLLTQFYDIIQSHGIMLSAKKSTNATDNIEFLDASDESWGAILLEELNDKEHFIAYASGQFSDTQKHYHSVFKEILAVKNGIKKFEYHLIGHHFLIRMDSSAFPNIFNFKEALTKKTFPFDKNFSTVFAIQEFARKALFRFFMKAYLVTEPFPFSTFHPENLFLIGLTLDPSKETTEDVLWPYFQHPDTNLFWTQDQVYEWFTAPHIVVIENEIQSTLHNYLCQLNHQTPPHKDIFHTSLGPQHDLIMIPTLSAISKPKCTGIIIKEEKPDYTDFLYQDSQDPWEEFLPLSQHLQQFPQPTMCEPGSSSQPSKADKATQMPSPKSQPSLSKPGYRRDCTYPPCRGPQYSKKVCFGLYNPRENVLKVLYRGISAGNPSLRTTGPKYSLNCCSSGITTPLEKISLRTEQIETKVDSITAQMQQIHQNLQSRIGQLDSVLRAMLAHIYNGLEFDQKEKEIRRLKAELAQIESEKQRPTLFTTSPPIPSIGPTTPRIFMSSGVERITPSWLPLIRCRSRCLHWSCIGMELLIVGDPFKRHKLNELMTGNLSRDLDDCGDLVRFRYLTRRPHPKEYIQSSHLDQCSLQATPAEQYVTLEIHSELISNWKREGYTHLHLRDIRIILTLHGRKGLPVTARIAMLDTRFKQYQDAVIGTVLTTLHAGSVLLTFYPNFNLSLQDANLPTALKVQV